MEEIKIIEDYVDKVWFDSLGRERVTRVIVTEPVEVEMELLEEEQI